MTFAVTITQKGQFTLPKAIRDALDISDPDQVELTFDKKAKTITFSKIPSFEELDGYIAKKTKQPVQNAVSLRAKMEEEYTRV